MIDEATLANLLLRWQDAEDQGGTVSLKELCSGDVECEAILRQRIRDLKSMQWIERVDAVTKEVDHSSDKKRPQAWHAGQEPVPGYRLVRPLGRGGFSEVWEAQGARGIPVALKLVFADRSFPEEQSLELLKAIRHPRIVSVFGAWSVNNGLALAMELADESVFDRWSKIQEDDAKREALSQAALTAGAEALDYLNIEHHIQHRDVKPQNLLMFGDYVKIADFGIAKFVENHSTGHTGFFTVAYAPPEFFRGRSAAESDQYSLAVTYVLLRSGKLPFCGNSASMTHGHLHRTPDLAGLPASERGAVARALSKEPKDRWPSCRAFAEAVLSKKRVFLLPKTRRQLLMAAAVAGVAAIPVLAWQFAKPTPLKEITKFEVPPGKPNGLSLRQVVGSMQYIRQVDRLIRTNYFVVGNGMGGAFLWDGHTGKYRKTLIDKDGVGVAIPTNEDPWCLTGHNDGSLYAWDLVTGNQKHQYTGHKPDSHVMSIDIITSTFRSVTGSTDGTIKTWMSSKHENVSLEPMKSIPVGDYVTGVKFLADGSKIASVSNDGMLRLWDTKTGLLLSEIDASSTKIWALDVSTDGNHALTGDANGVVRLWDLNNGTKLQEFLGHEGLVYCVSFTSHKELVCSGADRTLRFWNISSGREEYRATHDSEVMGVSPANYRMNGAAHLTATAETVYAWEPIV